MSNKCTKLKLTNPEDKTALAVALIEQALSSGEACESLGLWRERLAEVGVREDSPPVIFVADPQDEHGALYLKRTWGEKVHADLLEEIRETGHSRTFTSVMSAELAALELPHLEDVRKAITRDLPEGACAWILGVGEDCYALSTVPFPN